YHHVAIPCEADEAQVDQLRQAIGIYFATHKDCRQLTVEIVLPKPLPAASNLPPQGVAPTSGTDDEGTVNASDDESNTDVSET
ncbi:MAG: hypothetical protein KGQ49_03825, partial [Verrucomicrobia bacterium]|nr:hypothetical protein [Verrucomicrobiota bacterium]